MLNELAADAHATAVEKGFYHLADAYGQIDYEPTDWMVRNAFRAERLALIHSEISEALDALRKEDYDAEEEEIADAIIRLLDYSSYRQFDLDRAVALKMAKNETREYRHGRAF